MKTKCDSLHTMLLMMTCVIFVSGCSGKADLENKAWFQYASRYDRALRQLAENGEHSENWNNVFTIRQEYLQAAQPSETEVVSALKSPNRNIQRVALAAMSIKPIETDQMVELLCGFLRDMDLRIYAVESLLKCSNLSNVNHADLGEELLTVIQTRKDDELYPKEYALLAEFPSEKAAQFLTEQLLKEDEGIRASALRYSAFEALKKMGRSYYDNALKDVSKNGSAELKKELGVWEKLPEQAN